MEGEGHNLAALLLLDHFLEVGGRTSRAVGRQVHLAGVLQLRRALQPPRPAERALHDGVRAALVGAPDVQPDVRRVQLAPPLQESALDLVRQQQALKRLLAGACLGWWGGLVGWLVNGVVEATPF